LRAFSGPDWTLQGPTFAHPPAAADPAATVFAIR
jgi:hypothetical protein